MPRPPTSRRTLGLDLDGTLVVEREPFAAGLEPRRPLAWLLSAERLRRGTRSLLAAARERGWRVAVYTTSMRSPLSVRLLFVAHGLWLDAVINHQRHRHEEQRQRAHWPAKYPPAMGIDLLVDDTVDMEQQGRRHGFRVVRVRASDADWVERVTRALDET